MIYVLSFWSDIGFTIKQALRTFTCEVAAVLYDWIIDLYNVFMYVARAEILEDSFIQKVYTKVGMILGIFMIFKLSFSLIQSLVDPNKFTDEKNGFGGIIKRSIISIVLLGITPSLFNMAFDLQNLIVGTANNTDNIIYKIIVGDSPSKDAETFGHTIATELYFGFYTENDPHKLDQGIEITYPDDSGAHITVHNYEYLKTAIEAGTLSFKDTVDYLTITNAGEYVIKWDGLFAIGFAIFMIYILVTYCIQVATRVIQLAYLQLVAPVPILSYISDPDGAFKNWTRQCLTTYLDLFIRLAIIYFIITVSTQILEAVENTESVLFSSTGLQSGSSTLFWVKIFLIIGLLMFGKRVPDLLKDLFPNMGGGAATIGFGIKSPKKTIAYIPIVGGTANKAIGWTGKKMGQGAKFVGKKATSPITNRYNHWKDDRKNASEIKAMEKPGKKLYEQANRSGELSIFKNDEFKNSYLNLKNAKDENKAAEKEYEEAKASGDAARLSAAIDRRNSAAKALNDAQKSHDNVRKRYGGDARREDDYKLYKSMHPSNSQPAPTPNPVSTPNPQPTRTTMANGNTVTPAGIEVVENNRPQQPSRTERERQTARSNTQDEHAQLVEKYNNATDPTEKDRIRREIDDFEKRH